MRVPLLAAAPQRERSPARVGRGAEGPRRRRWLRRVLLGLGVAIAIPVVYVATFLVLGAIPVGPEYVRRDDGITIWVTGDAVHTDIVVPARNALHDWTLELPPDDFLAVGDCWTTHYSFGWGDRGFYLEVGEWSELRVSTALAALTYLSTSAMHVAAMGEPWTNESQRRLVVSEEQYLRLVAFIRASFARDADGRVQRIAGHSYWGYDAFYEARGRYGLFYTCNTWTNRALRDIGVPTAAWALFPSGVMQHLPE